MKATIHVGNCVEVLKGFAENSIDAIVCDPPYEINFMSKSFDRTGVAHNVATWQECLRVLKPGGFCLAFGGDRTHHRMVCAVEDAGFDIRGNVVYMFGSGFPKNLSVSKAIDREAGAKQKVVGRRKHPTLKDTSLIEESANAAHGENTWAREWDITAPSTEEAKRWEGFGTALKPAMELICLARKPLIGTVAENVTRFGTGALNIDGCRVEYLSEADKASATPQGECTAKVGALAGGTQNETERSTFERPEQKGRWPANVILECTCESTELVNVPASGSVSGEEPSEVTQDIFGKFKERKPFSAYPGKAVRHTNPECPCFMLDAQSGDNTSGAMKHDVPSYAGESVTPLLRGISGPSNQHGDSGGASRFFQTVRGEEPSAERTYEESGSTNFAMQPGARRSDEGSASRFFYTAKADRTERNAGLESMPDVPCGMMEDDNYAIKTGHGKPRNTKRQNTHPTVKPVDLMAYLCRLVCPPHGTVLDPFMGSGSTGIAALREGFEFIGIEIDANYASIAEMRIKGDNPMFNEVEVKAPDGNL